MNNQQKPGEQSGSKGELTLRRAGKFILGKGFYIVLLLCLAAIGVSGYVIFSLSNQSSVPEIPEIPDFGLSTTVPYSGVALATKPPKTTAEADEVNGQTMIPNATAAPSTEPPATSKPPMTVAKVFYMRPLAGEVIRGYSDSIPVYNPTMDDWRVHTGLDIAAAAGEAVCAVAPGTVSAVYKDYFAGLTVEILHLDGLTSVYCGLAEGVDVTIGDSVTAGTIIGCVGETAIFESLDGPHLHFEMREGARAIDPGYYLPGE